MMRMILDHTDIKKDPIYNTFFSMLRQLIIMSKAFLHGHPIEEQRLKEIIRTAEDVVKDYVDWKGQKDNFRSAAERMRFIGLNHVFYERVKLLAYMAKSFAQGNPVGDHRRMALKKNLDDLCDMLQYVPEQDYKNRESKTYENCNG